MTMTQPASVDDYVRSLPDDVRETFEKVRRTIRSAVPAGAETITYQMPTITLDGRYLVSFAAWKRHIALYPIPTGEVAFEQELAPYRAARRTARFPLGRPMPYDLIARLVALRVQQQGSTGA